CQQCRFRNPGPTYFTAFNQCFTPRCRRCPAASATASAGVALYWTLYLEVLEVSPTLRSRVGKAEEWTSGSSAARHESGGAWYGGTQKRRLVN
ncbi:unnamed protein product, partial [Ectocarpus sp. 6 AP-2014]